VFVGFLIQVNSVLKFKGALKHIAGGVPFDATINNKGIQSLNIALRLLLLALEELATS